MDIPKNKRIANVLSALGALVIIITIVCFGIYTLKENDINEKLKIENSNLQELIDNDSIFDLKIKKYIEEYTISLNNHDAEKAITFFTDTLSRFFLSQNISKKDAFSSMKSYWKKYPNSHNIFYLPRMSIKKMDSLHYILHLPSTHSKSSKDSIEIIREIRLNESMKIYYVRDFLTGKE